MLGDSDVGGSNGRRIQVRAARGALKKKPRRNGFTRSRKQDFLDHFAATANATAAGRAVGVSKSTVYAHRLKDPVFRAAWNEALGEGSARVEANSVRWASRTLREMDPKVALAILESYRRNGERRPGEIFAQPYDMAAVAARLEAKMRTLGMIGEAGAAEDSASPGPSPEEEGK